MITNGDAARETHIICVCMKQQNKIKKLFLIYLTVYRLVEICFILFLSFFFRHLVLRMKVAVACINLLFSYECYVYIRM